MSKKKICFIAQFPPPMSGLTKAIETLYHSNLSNIFEFKKIDTKNNNKFIINLLKILINDSELFYLTLSQSKFGNIRDLIILKLLELKGKKCLVHLHGGYYRNLIENKVNYIQKKANYDAIKKVEGVIVLGSSLKMIFKDMIDEEKIFIVPNCIDDEFLITYDELKSKINAVSKLNKIKCLYLSNFIESKGYKKILEVAKHLKEKNISNIEFIFAGKFFNKKDNDFFIEYIRTNNLQSLVTYEGIVEGEKKKKILKECDIFILMTRYPKEGQPISIIEAMGNGQVILTTDHSGIPDIVKNEKNGFIFKETEETRLLDKLIWLAENENVRKKIMVNNYNNVLINFQESNYLKNMESLFNEIW